MSAMSETKKAALSGKYAAYPEYKDSGVEWLGDLPCHWQVLPTKRFFKLIAEPAPQNNNYELLSVYTEIGVKPRKELEQKGNKASTTDGYWQVKKGDIIVNKLLAWMGAVGYSAYNGVTSPAYDILRPTSDFNTRFYHYLFRSEPAKQEFKRWSRGIMEMRLRLYFDELGRILMPFPPKDEIEKITAFLDHETAKIDTLIEKQQQLIELLKEKRQAVISHAVTKGISYKGQPDEPMKDSGVEWLGEVPEHWVVAQLKFNTKLMQTGPFGSQLHAEDYVENGTPLINPAHMVNGKIIPDPQISVDEETRERLSRHQLNSGDIIFARRGELGRCAVVKENEAGWLCGTGSLKATLNSKLIAEYAYLLITSSGIVAELSLESKGSTMDNLNTATLGKIRTPVPPIKEQKEILEYVETVSGKYKLLVENAEAATKLMQERRTALISAAVTGKIDVRHHVSRSTSNAEKQVCEETI